MYLLAFQFAFSSFARCYFADQKRLEAERKQGDAELIRRVLSANFCVDERGEPRSAPLLLGYEPQVKSFLEGPIVPRSEAFEILAPSTVHRPASRGRAARRLPRPYSYRPSIRNGSTAQPIQVNGQNELTLALRRKRKSQAKGKGKET
jgi:hypothetical protein